MQMGQKNFSCRHPNPALRNVDFLLPPYLVTVTEPWINATVRCGDDEGDEITKLHSLFASFPVIAAEPEAVPLAEWILHFRHSPVSSNNKQHGAAFATLTPTYSPDRWGIVEERQGIGKH